MKYEIHPKSEIYVEEKPLLEGRTVFEIEANDTGLLDKNENRIYRRRSPVGFVRSRE